MILQDNLEFTCGIKPYILKSSTAITKLYKQNPFMIIVLKCQMTHKKSKEFIDPLILKHLKFSLHIYILA